MTKKLINVYPTRHTFSVQLTDNIYMDIDISLSTGNYNNASPQFLYFDKNIIKDKTQFLQTIMPCHDPVGCRTSQWERSFLTEDLLDWEAICELGRQVYGEYNKFPIVEIGWQLKVQFKSYTEIPDCAKLTLTDETHDFAPWVVDVTKQENVDGETDD